MRAVIQRVSKASVEIKGRINGSIGQGLLVLIGIEDADNQDDIEWLAKKIVQLRIFSDEAGLMNKSIFDINGNILLISQFTLFGQTKKGNRPSFIRASKPDFAIPVYESFIQELSSCLGKEVQTGIFGADMQISLINDGPVTIMMDTKNKE
ncbi:MAG: D-aminoacyl-tRNA deacylase [Bacteroidales bacterium]|nr:D-aminoacyl-tRNA deacylase [Bacteroidales bacterium]MDD3907628.1 D-aminoacyl-tRNA deacylase [Bacteroidales bacterium]MDD4711740.1 D-aminoacyl-tRNA deacylase [Bacteroidales bacterium]